MKMWASVALALMLALTGVTVASAGAVTTAEATLAIDHHGSGHGGWGHGGCGPRGGCWR